MMRSLTASLLAALALASVAALSGCGRPFTPATPPGFVDLGDQYPEGEYRATTADGAVTIEQVFCLGNCALSPAVMVGEKLYGRVDSKRFDEIIAGLEKEAAE